MFLNGQMFSLKQNKKKLFSVFFFRSLNLQTSIVSKQRLQKIFQNDELPADVGGTMQLNHEQWLKIRIVSRKTKTY